ncbi:MAG: DUF1622 domain-containing protein [Erysipelotrichaceae bacterium]|nr:DUF1622 domain-containing protein [Erysipelotrichaceae bacterium]
MNLLHFFESTLETVIQYGVVIMEYIGVVVILVSGFKSVIKIIHKDPSVRLSLAQGISLALQFKLGGEVMRTVIVREWNELMVLGAVIVLRAALTFLIHWEIKEEEHRLAVKDDINNELL